jgi:hypothetical protein
MRPVRFPTLIPTLCAAALFSLLGSGCATRAMKGTPFFTGEYEGRLGPPEDRVNLWPLLYYRDPALSFLWPVGEYTDTHLALRPLFSMHREKAGAPYSKYNVLWPLVQFDTHRDKHRAFPLFWGDGYFVAFPLYWHFGPFTEDSGTDALFPLWIYDRDPHDRDLHLLWPFARFHHGDREAGWRVWPLAGHRYRKDRLERHTFWLWPLGGDLATEDRSANWFLPLYGTETTPDSFSFTSLPWYDRRSPQGRTRAVPATLSWRRDQTDGSASLTLLLGLYRDATSADGKRRGHLIPIYAYGPDYTISPLYARSKSATRTLNVVPPLLSWRSRDSATGRDSLYAAGGLLHRRRGEEGQNRDWLLPLYYHDEGEGIVVSPLYARQQADDRKSSWSAIPPLLSWRSRDSAAGRDSLYAAGGLLHRRRGEEGQDRDWLLPLYYRDEAEGAWMSPLWARQRNADGTSDWSAVPPLLSWRSRDTTTGRDSLYLGAGLFHRRRGVAGQDRDWLLPLWYHDEAEGTLLTPLYARFGSDQGSVSAVPPLLSWRSRDSATGRDSLYAGAGLFHRRRGEEGQDRDWLLPLYYREEEDRLFLSPLYASQHRADGGLDWAVVPPLLALRRGSEDGSQDTFALGGLIRYGQNAQGRGRGWAIPLFAYGPEHFLSLPYARWLDSESHRRVQAIPPLLSWQGRDPATGRGDRFGLLGLYHTRIGVPEKERAGHLLPFYAYDRAADSFLTPLFGHWRSGGTRYSYFATPLAGTFDGDARGFWAIPLGGRYEDAKTRIAHVLWGRSERRTDGTGSSSFFPVFSYRNYGDPAPLLKAMDDDRAPQDWPKRTLGTETDWLLFLGGGKRVVSGQRGARGRLQKSPAGPSPGSLLFQETRESFLFPLWDAEAEREVTFDEAGARQTDRSLATRSLLLWLYDSRRESSPSEAHDYVQRRVLWRLWHYERLNGDVSMDLFPAMTWDRRTDGGRKFTFLWRLFRNETDAEGRRTLDILFLPVLRP